MVLLLARVFGIGIQTADMLVREVLSRTMRDRRAVARYAGLTGRPTKAAKRRDKGSARAQQAGRPTIGFLNSTSSDTNTNRLRGFHRGLKDSGYVEGENVAIEYRWAENQLDRLPALAAELVRRQVAVIYQAKPIKPSLG